jgi:hypothetical protein
MEHEQAMWRWSEDPEAILKKHIKWEERIDEK